MNSTNICYTAIVPSLILREKKVSSAELLSKSIERATAIATDTRLVPKRQLTDARVLIFVFYGS